MGKYPVIFKVKYFNEDFEEFCDEGVLYANNLKEAGEIIDDYYGEDFISCSFELQEEGLYFISTKKE